jgi:ubiquinone/menaquinone biosynthesis C-methylase UbiE
MNSILSYLGKVNASYLHANGRPATSALIQHLNCRPYEHILEIGHGTGATLILLKSKYRKTKFTGIDRSEIMYQKAKNRLRFCGIKDIPLLRTNSLSIPFPNNTFDKIYLESVLGIQERNDLKSMLKEIKRVLKPHGRLVMNETIWLESTSLSRINSINQNCKSEFEIIQANSKYPYLSDWKLLIQEIGF